MSRLIRMSLSFLRGSLDLSYFATKSSRDRRDLEACALGGQESRGRHALLIEVHDCGTRPRGEAELWERWCFPVLWATETEFGFNVGGILPA